MEIILGYSQAGLDAAVDFISKNNHHFLGQNDEIRNEILKSMEVLALDPKLRSIGTMGFILTCDCEYESIDNDENFCRIEIYVDPSLGEDKSDEDYVEFVINSGD